MQCLQIFSVTISFFRKWRSKCHILLNPIFSGLKILWPAPTLRLLILLCGLSITTTTYADTSTQQLAEKFNELHTMQADFTQEVMSNGEILQTATGNMKIARPNQFRWFSDGPLQQLIVSDGKKIWIYDIDLEQATVKDLGQDLGKTPIMLLSGNPDVVLEDYQVTQEQRNEQRIYQLIANSEEASFAAVKIKFKQLELQEMHLTDYLDQVTRLKFKNIVINQPIHNKEFQFVPPAGIDVIE